MKYAKIFWKFVFNSGTWALNNPVAAKAIFGLVVSFFSVVGAYLFNVARLLPSPIKPWVPWIIGVLVFILIVGVAARFLRKRVVDFRNVAAAKIGEYRYLGLGIRYRLGANGESIDKLVKRRIQNTSTETLYWEKFQYKPFGVDNAILICRGDEPPEDIPYVEVEAIDGGHIESLERAGKDGYGQAKFIFDTPLEPGETMAEPYIYRLVYHINPHLIPPYAQFQPVHDIESLTIQIVFHPNCMPDNVTVTYWPDGYNEEIGEPWQEKQGDPAIRRRPTNTGFVTFTFPTVLPGQSEGSYQGYGLEWRPLVTPEHRQQRD